MFRLSITDLINTYLLVLLGIVFGNWLFSIIARRIRERRRQFNLLRCSICSFPYEDGSSNPLPRCPNCGRLNERSPSIDP